MEMIGFRKLKVTWASRPCPGAFLGQSSRRSARGVARHGRDVRAPQKRGTQMGFSLLEVLIATTIFALISVAVFQTFRVGTSAYSSGLREAAVLQRARFALDALDQDFDTLFFRDETSYNVAARKLIEEYERARLDAEETNDWSKFEEVYGPEDGGEAKDKGSNFVGNPFEQGRLIDLQILGEDSQDQDAIAFAVRRPYGVGGKMYPFGLARVRYSLQGDVLVRSIESVEDAPRDWQGQELERKMPPDYTLVAQGVQKFDLKYAFWNDNQWYEVDSWNSANRQIRNPDYLLGDYEVDDDDAAAGIAVLGSDLYNELLNEQERQPYDRVPAYVRVHLEISDPESPARVRQFERIYRLPGSVETWVPNKKIEEEDQEEERMERDNRYTLVYPGALRK